MDSALPHGSECAAVFRSPLHSNAPQHRHFCYVWDDRQIVAFYEKRALES